MHLHGEPVLSVDSHFPAPRSRASGGLEVLGGAECVERTDAGRRSALARMRCQRTRDSGQISAKDGQRIRTVRVQADRGGVLVLSYRAGELQAAAAAATDVACASVSG